MDSDSPSPFQGSYRVTSSLWTRLLGLFGALNQESLSASSDEGRQARSNVEGSTPLVVLVLSSGSGCSGREESVINGGGAAGTSYNRCWRVHSGWSVGWWVTQSYGGQWLVGSCMLNAFVHLLIASYGWFTVMAILDSVGRQKRP